MPAGSSLTRSPVARRRAAGVAACAVAVRSACRCRSRSRARSRSSWTRRRAPRAAARLRRGQHRLQLADAAHDGFDTHAATAPPRRCTASASSSSVFWERRAHSASCSALLALLELVDRLAVAGRGGERLAAGGDLGLAPGQLQRGLDPEALGALQEGLRGDEVDGGDAPARDRVAAGVAGGGRRRRSRLRSRSSPSARLRNSTVRASRARSSARSRIVRTRSSRNVKEGVSTLALSANGV